ncbi:flagellar biosynthetic protein FliO, partial [bacterium]|nr:flagellar biosynthetic protein FliO [bacterium]
MGYLANFIVYTLAMVGVIVVALLVFKNATSVGGIHKSKYLKLVDTMSLGQRKMLYIVSTGHENFLIAGDADKTCLVSKLDKLEILPETQLAAKSVESFKDTIDMLSKPCYMDRSGIRNTIVHHSLKKIQEGEPEQVPQEEAVVTVDAVQKNEQSQQYKSVMRSLAEKIKG